jgi:hypothetical protein
MTFRLLLLLFGWVMGGAFVGLVSAAPPVTVGRLAVGLGAATVLGAVVAAWSLAEERRSGRSGWLVTRSVARGTYLVGWFVALAGVSLVGLAAAAALGWLATGGRTGPIDAAGYVAAVMGVAATAAAAIALGLVAGALLRTLPAIAVTLVACGLVAALAVVVADVLPWLPGGAHLLLARAGGPGPIIGDALRAAGTGLALAAILLGAARVALERSEL